MGFGNPTAHLISPGEDRLLKLLGAVPDLLVFDVGAHAGEYAEHVRHFCPTAKIWSFEPHPATYLRLQRVAQAAGFTALKLGLSDTTGSIPLYDFATSPNTFGSAQASMHSGVIETIYGATATPVDVEVTTLDAFVASANVSHVHLLKVDTEGNELAVLRGARTTIDARRIDIVQFESNEMNVMSRTFLHDFYGALPGFSFYRMLVDGLVPIGDYRPRTHELFFFQNVVAIRDDLSYRSILL
jgi:FkbM family methyltransferase